MEISIMILSGGGKDWSLLGGYTVSFLWFRAVLYTNGWHSGHSASLADNESKHIGLIGAVFAFLFFF